jgi:glycosyltransferase involved in cell wall biosynthesis
MKNKINILHIVDKYSYGGVETIVGALMSRFTSTKVVMSYVFLRNPNNQKIAEGSNLEVFDFAKYDFVLPLIFLVKYIKKNNINVIHTHHQKGFFLSLILKPFFSGIRFIHHEHGDILYKGLIYRCFFRLRKKTFFKVICVSDYVSDILVKKTNISRNSIAVLGSFVDPQPDAVLEKIFKTKANRKNFAIGFLGRISKVKGCIFLIRALPYVDLDEYEVVIAGDGPELENIVSEAKKMMVFDHVNFLGRVNGFKNIAEQFDIIVIPSISEASPVVLLEAWSFGIPVIISDIPSVQNIVKDRKNVLMFHSGNSRDLGEKITELAKNKPLIELLRKNGLEESKRHTFEEYAKFLEETYIQK